MFAVTRVILKTLNLLQRKVAFQKSIISISSLIDESTLCIRCLCTGTG